MLRKRKVSLNEISHSAAANLIAAVCAQGVRVSQAFVDTVGKAEHYQDKLQQQFPSVKITVREKADSLFAVVSAASILAKVTRDRLLQQWPAPVKPNKKLKRMQQQQLQQQQQQQQKTSRLKRDAANAPAAAAAAAEGSEEEAATDEATVYGSGYPGDRVTISFLKEQMDMVFGFPEIVRWSWQTAKEIFDKDGVQTEWLSPLLEETDAKTTPPRNTLL
ncbi:ribonuclease hi large subunit, putative [Eimeria brunetti]|uniref:Ribonuclease n=1 Tax=Eimeria brunetti TaxID=51314 RepID=U6LX64_9EIME|nr:ribonuclease hi large subunit, putative [Eimeria brunetti]